MENVVSDEQLEREHRRENFERFLAVYKQTVTDKPNLKVRYEKELLLFKKAIADPEPGYDIFQIPNKKVAEACMYIAYNRALTARKNIRVCGTYLYRVMERFARWIDHVFSEEELSEIIDCCVSSKELNPEQTEKVMVILHNIPKIIVHRSFSSESSDD